MNWLLDLLFRWAEAAAREHARRKAVIAEDERELREEFEAAERREREQ